MSFSPPRSTKTSKYAQTPAVRQQRFTRARANGFARDFFHRRHKSQVVFTPNCSLRRARLRYADFTSWRSLPSPEEGFEMSKHLSEWLGATLLFALSEPSLSSIG